MGELMRDLKRDLVLRNIRNCIERDQIDTSLLANRFLIFELSGPPAYSYISYHGDHAATAAEAAVRVFERSPNSRLPRIPPIDYGAVFDVRSEEVLAYLFRPL
jgi:hypothetical protein